MMCDKMILMCSVFMFCFSFCTKLLRNYLKTGKNEMGKGGSLGMVHDLRRWYALANVKVDGRGVLKKHEQVGYYYGVDAMYCLKEF